MMEQPENRAASRRRINVHIRKCAVRLPVNDTQHASTVRWPGLVAVPSRQSLRKATAAVKQRVWFFPLAVEQLAQISNVILDAGVDNGDSHFKWKLSVPGSAILGYHNPPMCNSLLRRVYDEAEQDVAIKFISRKMLRRWRIFNQQLNPDHENDYSVGSLGDDEACEAKVCEDMADPDAEEVEDKDKTKIADHEEMTTINKSRKVSSALSQLWFEHNLNKSKVVAAMRKLLRCSDLPSCKETPFHVAQFFLFIHERQCAWKMRKQGQYIFMKDAKPPARSIVYSNIPVFQNFTFCNNYRELDQGTRYFRSQMMLRWKQLRVTIKESKQTKWVQTVLFASYVYRQVNRVDTFSECYVGIPTVNQWPAFENWASDRVETQRRAFFTAAHQTMGLSNLIEGVKALLQKRHKKLKNIAENLVKASSEVNGVQLCYDIVKNEMNGCGPFFSWQIICDLLECKCLGSGCNDNQWTMLGPGARKGIKEIFKGRTKVTHLHLAQQLTQMQRSAFENVLKVDFCKFKGQYLSLKNIEHALCEYSKFLKLDTALRKRRICVGRTWKARSANTNISFSQCYRHQKERTPCDTCLNVYCRSCDTTASQDDWSWICSSCRSLESLRIDN